MAAIGYARVSTTDQDLALQLDALPKPAARACSRTKRPEPKPTALD